METPQTTCSKLKDLDPITSLEVAAALEEEEVDPLAIIIYLEIE